MPKPPSRIAKIAATSRFLPLADEMPIAVGTGICLTPQLGHISALAFMIDLHSRQYFSFGPFVVWIDIFPPYFSPTNSTAFLTVSSNTSQYSAIAPLFRSCDAPLVFE